MGTTSIEWTNRVWNPVRGCSRVSKGCDNCYAMRMAHRSSNPGGAYHGLTTIRRGKVDWAGMSRLIPGQLDKPLRWKKPSLIFVNSMSDLFHESLTSEEIAAVFGVMAAAPKHTFQVLTKRPERALDFFRWLETRANPPFDHCLFAAGNAIPENAPHRYAEEIIGDPGAPHWPLSNVWLGVSVENQKAADERIPLLLQCPAAIRWISAEPLLGPLEVNFPTRIGQLRSDGRPNCDHCCNGDRCDDSTHIERSRCPYCRGTGDATKLDWVVVGGESGHGARPFDVSWAGNIVHDCEAAKVPVFVKQLGRFPFDTKDADEDTSEASHDPATPADRIKEIYKQFPVMLKSRKGANPREWSAYLRKRQFPTVRAA